MTDELLFQLALGLALAGSVAVAIGLWSDALRCRFKRRRRCRRCWYDLSHTPGLRCSECGFEGRHERDVHRFRIRRGVVGMGALALLIGTGMAITPRWKREGPSALMPTTLLIAKLDNGLHRGTWEYRRLHDRCSNGVARWQARWIARKAERGDDDRMPLSDLWNDFYGSMLDACASSDSLTLADQADLVMRMAEVSVTTRDVVRPGEPVTALVSIRMLVPFYGLTVRLEGRTLGALPVTQLWPTGGINGFSLSARLFEGHHVLSSVPPASGELTYELKIRAGEGLDSVVRSLASKPIVIPVCAGSSMLEPLSPDESQVVADLLLEEFSPVVTELPNREPVGIWYRFLGLAEKFELDEGFTLGVRMEWVMDGVTLATARSWWAMKDGELIHESYDTHQNWYDYSPKFDILDVEILTPPLPNGRWVLRVTGCEETARRNPLAERYWEGSVEIPMIVPALMQELPGTNP